MNEDEREAIRQPDDDAYAEQLQKLGKTKDCPCAIDIYYAELGQRKLMLHYSMECPVHYPATAKVLRGETESRPHSGGEHFNVLKLIEIVEVAEYELIEKSGPAMFSEDYRNVSVPIVKQVLEALRIKIMKRAEAEENSE